jgi:hydrogenase maturation protease
MKTIVVGVGNPILQDDGVGIHVVNELRGRVDDPAVALDTAFTGGLNLLDTIRGYDRVILIDAVKQKDRKRGEVQRFLLSDASSVHSCNPHDVSLSEALHLARKLGEKHLPEEIVVIGIVIKSAYDFGDRLSLEVERAVPTAVNMVLSELQQR